MIAPVIVGTVLGLMVIWILVVEHYMAQRQVQALRQQAVELLQQAVELRHQINLVDASNEVLRDALGEELEDWL
jgi:hypothetical protein